MKKSILYSTAVFMAVYALSLFSACSDDNADVTKPVINLIEPAEGDELLIGSSTGIHFEMDLSDDVMLASYKIEIHNNFDNHSHGTTKAGETTTPFSFNKTYDISGQKNAHIHHHEILIPATATPGKYHLMIYCTDSSGNESYVARSIVFSTTAEEDHDHSH